MTFKFIREQLSRTGRGIGKHPANEIVVVETSGRFGAFGDAIELR